MVRNTRLAVKNLLAFQDSQDPQQCFYKAKGERNSYPTFDRSHMNKINYVSHKLFFLPSLQPKRFDTIVQCLVTVSC